MGPATGRKPHYKYFGSVLHATCSVCSGSGTLRGGKCAHCSNEPGWCKCRKCELTTFLSPYFNNKTDTDDAVDFALLCKGDHWTNEVILTRLYKVKKHTIRKPESN